MMFNWTLYNLSIKYFLGLMSQENYLQQHVFPHDHAEYYHTVSYINHNSTAIDKVLMLFEARGLYSDVPVIQDNLLTNWTLLAGKMANLNCLEATNISHVLLYGAALDYHLKRGLDPAAARWSEFQNFRITVLYRRTMDRTVMCSIELGNDCVDKWDPSVSSPAVK
jgi:hypothetical protein